MDVAALADLLHETAEHHGAFEAVAPPHDWWDWYAAYMDARAEREQLRTRPPRPPGATWRRSSTSSSAARREHARRRPVQRTAAARSRGPGPGRTSARPPQPRLLPRDVRPPADQHDHRDDRRRARRARRPDRAGRGPQRRRLRQRQPRLLPGPLRRGERPGRTAALGRPTGLPAWLDLLVRLAARRWSASPRSADARAAREASSCWPATCASPRARTLLLGQFEVGIGVVPGGGPMARLAAPGRSRPGARDPPRRRRSRRTARRAVRVRQPRDRRRPARRRGRGDRLRLARFDHDAIARTKSYVDQVTLPADSELPA